MWQKHEIVSGIKEIIFFVGQIFKIQVIDR